MENEFPVEVLLKHYLTNLVYGVDFKNSLSMLGAPLLKIIINKIMSIAW